MNPQAHGIENPTAIDVVALSPAGDRVDVVMAQASEWDGSDRLLLLLQAKWKNYLAFAADGQLVRAYPEVAGLPWRLVLSCQSEPDERTVEFVIRADAATRAEGGTFEIRRQWITN